MSKKTDFDRRNFNGVLKISTSYFSQHGRRYPNNGSRMGLDIVLPNKWEGNRQSDDKSDIE